MFDLEFYDKINEVFYENEKIKTKTSRNVLSMRKMIDIRSRNELMLDLQKHTEKIDDYVKSGFMDYIDDYYRYFNQFS